MSKDFQFKQFTIKQVVNPMKFGVDSMILGAFAGLDNHSSILDIGCGTGVLGLMQAQKFSKAAITLIEIDRASAIEAQYNIDKSNFSERCRVVNDDFLNHDFSQSFDLIISNPPFHIEDTPSPNAERKRARSTTHEMFEAWFTKCEKILSDDGILQIIIPYTLMGSLDDIANTSNLWLCHELAIKPKPDKAYNRAVVSYSKELIKPIRDSISVRNSDNTYSELYKSLTNDFYLSLD